MRPDVEVLDAVVRGQDRSRLHGRGSKSSRTPPRGCREGTSRWRRIRTPIAVIHSHGPSIRQRVTLATGAMNENRPNRAETTSSPTAAYARSGVTPNATRRNRRDRAPIRIGIARRHRSQGTLRHLTRRDCATPVDRAGPRARAGYAVIERTGAGPRPREPKRRTTEEQPNTQLKNNRTRASSDSCDRPPAPNPGRSVASRVPARTRLVRRDRGPAATARRRADGPPRRTVAGAPPTAARPPSAAASAARASSTRPASDQPDARCHSTHLVVVGRERHRTARAAAAASASSPRSAACLGLVHRLVGAREAEQPRQLVRRGVTRWSSTRHVEAVPRRTAATPEPLRSRRPGRHDERRRLPAAHVAALAAPPPGLRGEQPAWRGRRRSPRNVASIAAGTVGRSIMLACTRHARRRRGARRTGRSAIPVCAARRRPRRVDDADLAHGLAGSMPRDELGAGPRPAVRPSRSSRRPLEPVGDLGERLRRDGADARLDPRHAAADANQRLCTATPSSPVAGSSATIEYVMAHLRHASRACQHSLRYTHPGARWTSRGVIDRHGGGAAGRGRGRGATSAAARQDRPRRAGERRPPRPRPRRRRGRGLSRGRARRARPRAARLQDPPPVAASAPSPASSRSSTSARQFAQLIARRVRELNVYSELLPHDTPLAELERARRPARSSSPAARCRSTTRAPPSPTRRSGAAACRCSASATARS